MINVYSGDIILRNIPGNIAVSIYLELINIEDTDEVSVEILLDRKKIYELKAGFSPERTDNVCMLITPQILLSVEKDTDFKVFVSAEGYQKTKVISKRIFEGAVPP